MTSQDSSNTFPIGMQLAERRKELKLSLSKVAATLRIRNIYLKAIEEDKLELIPAGIYASAYIKSYAKFLGMSIDESNNNTITKEKGCAVPLRNSAVPHNMACGSNVLWISGAAIIIANIVYWFILR